MKNDLAVLNVIAASKWKRPIYFTSNFDELGFGPYLRKDGLSYRFVPVAGQQVNTDWMMDKLMTKFASGNADKPNVYFDEENRRHLNSIRMAYATASLDLAQKNKKEEARKMLNKADKLMLEENFPYGMVSRNQQQDYISMLMLQAAYAAEDTVLAARITRSLKKDLEQQVSYYNQLDENKAGSFDYVADQSGRRGGDKNAAEQFLMRIAQMEQQYKAQQSGMQELPPGAIKNTPATPPTGAKKN